MSNVGSEPLTPEQIGELERLSSLSEAAIDTTAIPEQRDWSGAQRGLFFRPVKRQLTLRLDADLVTWFKAHAPEGKGYQTGINNALRTYVAQQMQQHGEQRGRG